MSGWKVKAVFEMILAVQSVLFVVQPIVHEMTRVNMAT